MTPDDVDQDQLAAEWAAALETQEGGEAADPFEAATAKAGAGGGDALAEEWAKALATEEETSLRKEKEQQHLATRSTEPHFKDMTAEAKASRPEGTNRELDFILDIPLDVSAELGRTRLLINELHKLAGEPLEIFVNGKLVARGEAVVINEKFGVRLTDIISPIERVKSLA